MGIVTGNTADSRVRAVETLAVRQTIRCETHIHFPPPVISDHCLPGAMTMAAKVRDILGGELAQTRRSGIELPVERVQQVGG